MPRAVDKDVFQGRFRQCYRVNRSRKRFQSNCAINACPFVFSIRTEPFNTVGFRSNVSAICFESISGSLLVNAMISPPIRCLRDCGVPDPTTRPLVQNQGRDRNDPPHRLDGVVARIVTPSESLSPFQVLPEIVSRPGVETHGRFIQDQQLGLVEHALGQFDPAAEPAR